MYNPRFPNHLSIKRAIVDESGMPIFNYDGTQEFEVLSLEKPVYFDSEIVRDDDGNVCTEMVTEIEFGHRTDSRSSSTDGDVVVAQYVLHTPIIYTPLKYGDIAVISDTRGTWTAIVVGKKDFNWGSNIFVNEAEN